MSENQNPTGPDAWGEPRDHDVPPSDGAHDGAQDAPEGEKKESELGAAARALAEATGALTRALGRQAQEHLPDVADAVTRGLRQAAKDLSDATERMGGAAEPGDRRKDKVDATRAGLLEAAAKVIAERGYEGASVGDIAAAAGFTKGALYAHFGSKAGLMQALAQDRFVETIDVPGIGPDGVDTAALAGWLRAGERERPLLLQLEFLTYGLRNRAEANELADLHRALADRLAGQVAAARAHQAGAEVTERDRATTVAVLSVLRTAPLEGRLTGSPDWSADAVADVIAHLVSA